MNTGTHQTEAERTPVQLAAGNVARAAAMLSAIERLALLLEQGCNPEAFDLATAIQACAAEGAAELRRADEALAGTELH